MRIWRFLAVLLSLVWLIVLITDNFISILEGTEIKTMVYNNVLILIYLMLSVFWAIYPYKFILIGMLFCIIGLEGMLSPPVNFTNAFLIYLLGCLFVQKNDLLFKFKGLTGLFGVLPFVSIVFQFRFSAVQVMDSFLDLAFLIMFFILTWFLFKDSFTIRRKETEEEDATIDLSVLKPIELEILKEVLENKTYYAIALEKNKSESAVKFIMRDIYNKLNVTGRKELLVLYERNTLLLPQ